MFSGRYSYWIGIALFPLALGLVIGGIGLC
jgi:hypothetical protein